MTLKIVGGEASTSQKLSRESRGISPPRCTQGKPHQGHREREGGGHDGTR